MPKTIQEGDPELERPDEDAVRDVSKMHWTLLLVKFLVCEISISVSRLSIYPV